MRVLWVALAVLALATGTARAGSIGVGVFGGASAPVLQDDEDNGSIYGVRVPVKLVPLFTAEPFYSSSQLGDKTIDIAPGISTTREGSEVYSYGLNAMLTMGGPVSFYPFVGLGRARFERSGQEEKFTSYHLGLGLGLHPIPKINVDLRAELQAAADKDGVARKMLNVTLGASYALISLP